MKVDNEEKTEQGNIIAYACGPLKRHRYINPKIEQELVEFKKEVEEKFKISPLNSYKFPLKQTGNKAREDSTNRESENVSVTKSVNLQSFMMNARDLFNTSTSN